MLPRTLRAVDDVATHPHIYLHTHSHTYILDISIWMTDDSVKSAPNSTTGSRCSSPRWAPLEKRSMPRIPSINTGPSLTLLCPRFRSSSFSSPVLFLHESAKRVPCLAPNRKALGLSRHPCLASQSQDKREALTPGTVEVEGVLRPRGTFEKVIKQKHPQEHCKSTRGVGNDVQGSHSLLLPFNAKLSL